MAEKSTFVKIDRNIADWRWFYDPITLQVFLWLIIKANVEDHNFRDMTIHRGQLFTSIASICSATKRSARQVRTALQHLISTNEVTSQEYPYGRLITVVSYDTYQTKPTNKSTNNRQATDKQPTSDRQQYKNIKEHIENEKKESAPATPDGGGRAEWEIRRELPDYLIGQFESEEQFQSWFDGEGYDPH